MMLKGSGHICMGFDSASRPMRPFDSDWVVGMSKKKAEGLIATARPPLHKYDLLATTFVLSRVVRVSIARCPFSSECGAKVRILIIP